MGGESALPNEFPFLVSIQMNERHYCEGSILTNSLILTAAHCCFYEDVVTPLDVDGLSIVAGQNNLTLCETQGDCQRIRVESMQVFSNFSASRMVNDLAVMRLSEPLNLIEGKVTVAKLILDKNEAEALITNQNSTYDIAGWGYQTQYEEATASYLRKAQIQIVNVTQCYSIGLFLNDIDTQLCVGTGNGISTWYVFSFFQPPNASNQVLETQEDHWFTKMVSKPSFNILHCFKESFPVVVGVTSYGPRSSCGFTWKRTVFTKLYPFKDWIEAMVSHSVPNRKNESFCVSFSLMLNAILTSLLFVHAEINK